MKSIQLFNVALLAIIFSHTVYADIVKVTNKTDTTLESVTASFDFTDQIGKTHSIGNVTKTNVGAGKTATLNSKDAIHAGKILRDPKSATLKHLEVVVVGMSGPKLTLSLTEKNVSKNVTTFNVVKTESKLGLSRYEIKAAK